MAFQCGLCLMGYRFRKAWRPQNYQESHWKARWRKMSKNIRRLSPNNPLPQCLPLRLGVWSSALAASGMYFWTWDDVEVDWIDAADLMLWIYLDSLFRKSYQKTSKNYQRQRAPSLSGKSSPFAEDLILHPQTPRFECWGRPSMKLAIPSLVCFLFMLVGYPLFNKKHHVYDGC